jgi:tRNA A37 threonylcarbamoyladenosine biosynthesis protein TsaE
MKHRIGEAMTDRMPSDAAVATTRMVGRRREIEHLQSLLGSAIGGAGGVTTVIGDPGAGKTRLVEAAGRRLDADR